MSNGSGTLVVCYIESKWLTKLHAEYLLHLLAVNTQVSYIHELCNKGFKSLLPATWSYLF